MLWQDHFGIYRGAPPVLRMYNAVGFFTLVLDVETWIFPSYLQWDIEYQISPDGITYGPWTYAKTVSKDFVAYNYYDVDITQFYAFRYTIKNRSEVSTVSDPLVAGRPVILIGSGTSFSYGTYS